MFAAFRHRINLKLLMLLAIFVTNSGFCGDLGDDLKLHGPSILGSNLASFGIFKYLYKKSKWANNIDNFDDKKTRLIPRSGKSDLICEYSDKQKFAKSRLYKLGLAHYFLHDFVPYFSNGLMAKLSPFLKRVKPEDALFQGVAEIAKKLNVGCPNLYLFESGKLVAEFIGLNNLVISTGFLKLLTDSELEAFLGSLLSQNLMGSAWLNQNFIEKLFRIGEKAFYGGIDFAVFKLLIKNKLISTDVFVPNFELKYALIKERNFFVYWFVKNFIFLGIIGSKLDGLYASMVSRADKKSILCLGNPETLIGALNKLKNYGFFDAPSLSEFVVKDLAQGRGPEYIQVVQTATKIINYNFKPEKESWRDKIIPFLMKTGIKTTPVFNNINAGVRGLNYYLSFTRRHSRMDKNWLAAHRISQIKALMAQK